VKFNFQPTNKQNKALEYWKAQKQLKAQGPVADPKLNPSHKDFFLHAKQRNMDLVKDEYSEAVQKIMNWSVSPWMLKKLPAYSLQKVQKHVLLLVDTDEKFSSMMKIVEKHTLMTVDLEGSQSYSFLGKFVYT